eukprot:scaffold21497_cov32-Tisochrysis_lutea.AAC.2
MHLGEEEVEGGRGVDHVDGRSSILAHIVLDDIPVTHPLRESRSAVEPEERIDGVDTLYVCGGEAAHSRLLGAARQLSRAVGEQARSLERGAGRAVQPAGRGAEHGPSRDGVKRGGWRGGGRGGA